MKFKERFKLIYQDISNTHKRNRIEKHFPLKFLLFSKNFPIFNKISSLGQSNIFISMGKYIIFQMLAGIQVALLVIDAKWNNILNCDER